MGSRRVFTTLITRFNVNIFYVLPTQCIYVFCYVSCSLRSRGASFQDGIAAGKGFLCAPFWGVQICARFRKDAPCVFSKPYTKLTLHCSYRSGHLKTEHIESLFLLRCHLGNWPHSKHEKQTAGSAWETWTVAAADGVCCARVRWEINFLLTFETAPSFCVYPVYDDRNNIKTGSL